jgi:hypothetical protein
VRASPSTPARGKLGSGWGLRGSVELAVNPVAVTALVEQVASYEARMCQLEALLQQVGPQGRGVGRGLAPFNAPCAGAL